MSRYEQNEIHELAKQMSEAISTEVEIRRIKDEAKLRAVLIANGWRKASEVAEEIFAEIDNALEVHIESFTKFHITQKIAELKKKYTVTDTNGCLSMKILEIIGLIDAMFERQRFESSWVDKKGVVIGYADIGYAFEVWDKFIKKELLEEMEKIKK